MGEKIVIGPYNKGLKNDVEPFNIDNDNFPQLINAYQWRGRVKRKRGTKFLARLQRQINSSGIQTNGGGSFSGNLLTGLETNATLVFNSIVIGASSFTDTTPASGVLTGSAGGTGTAVYNTGAATISGASPSTNIQFQYYPALPVMGLEDLQLPGMAFPGTIAFDTKYSYNIPTNAPANNYDVTFFKNPLTDATFLPGYTRKTTATPFTWNGQNYQQFWSTNYQGALWATNGITVPFTSANIGMQFAPKSSISPVVSAGGTNTLTIVITGSPLVIGDFVFFNEWTAGTAVNAQKINFQTAFVTNVSGTSITFKFPFNGNFAADTYTPGIIQYLTNVSSATNDCMRWYDGDPTGSVPGSGLGWVNFTPPISQSNLSIGDLPAAQYYLVTARIVVPFKDRLLFFGPVVQSSSGIPIYLQDTVIYSFNGTPYYTASFNGDPTLTTTQFTQMIVPANQTAQPNAYWGDLTGYGGFITAGISQPINAVTVLDDVLGVQFNTIQTKLCYSNNDIVPFLFYTINNELGSQSPFSVINMDKSALTLGSRGILTTTQTSSARIDLDIPNEVFNLQLLTNGNERVCANRDFINEWVYFTYSTLENNYVFPTKTLLYNYRSDSWGMIYESYTTYGQFKKSTGDTWQTLTTLWQNLNDPWEDYELDPLNPLLIGGNQEGFIMEKDVETQEESSLFIKSFSAGTFTIPDHCLLDGDIIIITGCIGTLGNVVNGQIFVVSNVVSKDQITLVSPLGIVIAGTYIGGGLITRIYIPFIQSKQFPTAWSDGRKTRLGPQQYLLTKTGNSQVTLYIFLSQSAIPWNSLTMSPQDDTIFSTVLYTCPESTNLGLTPSNINLQSPYAIYQDQIWHRINTSLLGDTVQFAITLQPGQATGLTPTGFAYTITGATNANPCVITLNNSNTTFNVGQLVFFQNVGGMTQLNFTGKNYYYISAQSTTTITLQLDSTTFGSYTSGGTVQVATIQNAFAEIELHGAILDVTPSALLS